MAEPYIEYDHSNPGAKILELVRMRDDLQRRNSELVALVEKLRGMLESAWNITARSFDREQEAVDRAEEYRQGLVSLGFSPKKEK